MQEKGLWEWNCASSIWQKLEKLQVFAWFQKTEYSESKNAETRKQCIRKLYKKFEAFNLSIDWNIAESLMIEKKYRSGTRPLTS